MRDLIGGIFFFGFSLFILWSSLRVGVGTTREPGSGFISLCVGVMLAVLSLVLVYKSWNLREVQKPHSIRVILALISLFAYSFALESLGFLLSTFVLLVIFFRLGEPRPWWALIGMSMLATTVWYLVFGLLLKISFPPGLLGIGMGE